MTKLLQTFIRDLSEDSLILDLLKEIEMVTKFPLESFKKTSMVVHYLREYRIRRPISKDSIDAIEFSDSLLLKHKIKKLHDTEIYWLCNEIAQMKKSGVERHAGKTLYVFLDQYLKDDKKIKRPPLPGYLIP